MKKSIILLSFILFIIMSCILPGDLSVKSSTKSEDFNKLFDHSNLHNIEISFTQAEWDGLISDMKTDIRTGNYRRADFTYTGPIGTITIKNVGFRTRGNTTRTIPYDTDSKVFHRAHFKIKFNEVFDLAADSQEYLDRKDRRFCELSALNLKWNCNNDNSQIRELYAYNLLNRAGIDTCKTGSTKLTITINGTKHYFGIYTIIEPIDKRFLKRIFDKNTNDGNLYKCLWQDNGPATLESSGLSSKIGVKNWKTDYRPSYDRKTNTDNTDYSDLINFVSKINSLSGSDLKTYLDNNFDIDIFLRFLAMNMLIGMPDDYWAMGNNYFLYFHPNGKIRFIPYDYDHGFGGGWHPFDTANADIYTWHDVAADLGQNLSRPLVEKVLAISEYKQKYETYLKDFITPANKLFVYSDYSSRYETLYSLYKDYLDNDINEGETMSNDSSVKNYFYDKTLSVVTQLGLNQDDYETINAPTIDGEKDSSYYSSGGNAEATDDGPGAGNFLEAPSAIYSYIDSSALYIYVPLNSASSTKRYLTLFLNRADQIDTNTISVHPDSSAIQKDTLWESLHSEGDLYYAYYPFWQTDSQSYTTITSTTKYYFDGSNWQNSSNTTGTTAKFSETGFEIKIPLSTIHADAQTGKYINIGIGLKEEGNTNNITDSYGGDNSSIQNKIFIADSIVIP